MASFCKVRARLRPWIVTTAAYLFLIHSMLAGLALVHMAATAAIADNPFVICFGIAPAPEQGAPETPLVRQSPCVLCATTLSAVALPDTGAIGELMQIAGETIPPPVAALGSPSLRTSPRLSQGPPLVA